MGEAGRSIIRKLPHTATWDEIQKEFCDVLGETDPKDRAIEGLLQYKPRGKGLGKIATVIITKAGKATDDVDMQAQLGLKAFLNPLPPGEGEISLPHSWAIFSKLKNEDKDLFSFRNCKK